jgi:predicted RNase H-like nuclease (RuvC/YqgF family)
VSNPADDGSRPPGEALDDLEGVVRQMLERLEAVTARAETAERESAKLNEVMRRFTGDPDESRDLLTRLKQLEDENHDLRTRLDDGRAGVERLIARIRFLESRP